MLSPDAVRSSIFFAARIFRVDNDALDFVDQFKRAFVAILQRLRGFAPTAIQNRVGSGDARGMRGVFSNT